MSERTFALLKPETVKFGLIGEVIRRIEKAGLKITAMKIIKATREQVEGLYRVHKGKSFYQNLIKATLAGPVVALVIEGDNAVSKLRKLVGATDPSKAEPGTIRGDLGFTITLNLIHASDDREVAEEEIKMFFTESEILRYRRAKRLRTEE